MKLYHNPASPFANRTRIIINECGLSDRVELEEIMVAPGNPNLEFANVNPLRMIPTLITDEGEAVFDSFAIADYLIRLSGRTTLLPQDGDERTRVLQTFSICNGATERAVATRYETFARPEEFRWQTMIDHNFDRIDKSLAWLNDNVADRLGGAFDLSEAAFVALLKYLDFRFPDFGWREKTPALIAPFDAMCEMKSVQAVYAS